MMLLSAITLAAAGAAPAPDQPAARQVAIFEGLRPYFSCLRTRMNPPSGHAPPTGETAVTTIRAYAAAADKACEATLEASMKALGITQPTAANPGGRVNAVRWRKLSALKQFHRSFVMQSALETYLPAGRGAYPQAGDAYDATVRLLPYFSCFEDAFRKQPAAFSKDHAAIRNAREGAAARCEPIRVTALRAAGVEPKAPPARLDPHARLRVAMSDFENGIVHYQLELNNASPPPQPPPAPPSPVPSRD